MVKTGSLLVFRWEGNQLTLFDPKTDTWYGPVSIAGNPPFYIIGSNSGLWLATGHVLQFVETADLIEAATKAGRVLTTNEYRKRRDEFIESSAPLDRAKFAMSCGEFDGAEELLKSILEKDTGNLEASALLKCHLNIGRAQVAIGKREYDRAQKLLESALDYDRRNDQATRLMQRVQRSQGFRKN